MIATITLLASFGVAFIGGLAGSLAGLALWSVASWWNARRGGGR